MAYMTPRQAAAHRWAITTARAIELAVQHGVDPKPASHDYEQARADLARVRSEERSAA